MASAGPRDPQLLKGVLPMLALALLREHDSYGYELVTRLRDAGLADIASGSVYPVLTRLEKEGLLEAYLVTSSAGPARKYYTPTSEGMTHLAAQHHGWQALEDVVATVLTPTLSKEARR